MAGGPLRYVEPHEPITADLWNGLVDELLASRLSAAAPLSLVRTSFGQALSLAVPAPLRLAELTSSLQPGGSAPALVKRFTPAGPVDTDAGLVTVYDPVGDKAGAVGDLCLVAWIDGHWLVVQLVC
jgi:hypothetical protein